MSTRTYWPQLAVLVLLLVVAFNLPGIGPIFRGLDDAIECSQYNMNRKAPGIAEVLQNLNR